MEIFDEDGSHNQGYLSLRLICGEDILFQNRNPGGNELLRVFNKSSQKDSNVMMVEMMERFDKASESIKKQVVDVPEVSSITIRHKLINCMHDGKERLAAVQHKVWIRL